MGLPVAIAAVFPSGQVLLYDGTAAEFVLEDLVDLGQGIEPFDQGRSIFAIPKAAVKLVTKFMGQTGDFSGATHIIRPFVDVFSEWSVGGSVRRGAEHCTRRRVRSPYTKLSSHFSFGAAFWARPYRGEFASKWRGCPIAVAYLAYLVRKSRQMANFEPRIWSGRTRTGKIGRPFGIAAGTDRGWRS